MPNDTLLAPRRLRLLAGALVFLALTSCSAVEEETESYQAWYRPVPLGFCPRFIVGNRHAWVVGMVAPGKERDQLERRVFTFRGAFELDGEGEERTRSSCDDRAYPIFRLSEVTEERLMALGEPEPKVTRGPGSIPKPEPLVAPATPAPAAKDAAEPGAPAATAAPAKRRFKGKRNRRTRRRVKQRRQRTP